MMRNSISSDMSYEEDGLEYLTDRTYQPRSKHTSLANISVPSFTAFRAQTSSIPGASPVRRKPLPDTASPRPAFSSAHLASPEVYDDTPLNGRPYSMESLLPQESTGLTTVLSPPLTEECGGLDLEQSVHNRFRSF